MDEFDETPPVSRPKPSKIPSWIMLGFILGAVFVWALPRPRLARAAMPPAAAAPVISAFAIEAPPRLTDVETYFEVWSKYALWDDTTTYVCLWDPGTLTFRDCFQIVRRGDDLFFRSVPRPRNFRARSDVPKDCPLEFLNPTQQETRGLFGAPVSPPPDNPGSGK